MMFIRLQQEENELNTSIAGSFDPDMDMLIGAYDYTYARNGHPRVISGDISIDELRVYNRVLSESEIQSLYYEQSIITGKIYTVSEILGYSACVGGATVKSIETGLSTTTNIYGSYEIKNITIGKHTLEISSNFFKPITICVDINIGRNLMQPIMLSEPMCSHLFTQNDLNEAIEKVETEKNEIIAQKDQTISQLTESMSNMYTEEYLKSAIIEAEKRGELKYDINNDGKVHEIVETF